MSLESDKIMFEVYREEGYSRRYRVVYFTELTEKNKEFEINAAMAGEHFYDGFLRGGTAVEAKRLIDDILRRLNAGEEISADEFEASLMPFMPT
ncbi:MAG: hypothetical protein AMXMBFR13_19710 [Phycisphaerae bacterium]